MGRVYDDIAKYSVDLERSLGDILQNEFLDYVKGEIQLAEEARVYSYEPKFYSRRKEDGGIKDKENMKKDYDYNGGVHTLTVTVDAEWQQLWGGTAPSESLADVIQHRQMYNAPRRPFQSEAEHYINKSYSQSMLTTILKSNGF